MSSEPTLIGYLRLPINYPSNHGPVAYGPISYAYMQIRIGLF